jgi:DNA-binding transcriptional LysR family regulator
MTSLAWDDLRFCLAVARRGSIRGAAADLGVSHSTVTRRIAALEKRLSTRLFDRSREGFTPTAAGARLLPHAERMAAEMAALARELDGRDQRMTGRISVTCCDRWVADLLLAALTRLLDANPALDLHLTADTRPFSLTRREADVAVRILARGASPPEHLVAERLVPLTVAAYVARTHLDRFAPDRSGARPRWLGSIPDPALLDELITGVGLPVAPSWGRFEELSTLAQAARHGLGLALLPTYIGDPDPLLVRVPGSGTMEVADLWLLSHPDLRANARLRVTRSTVAGGLRAHDALFRGAAVHPSRAETVHDGSARGAYPPLEEEP